MKHTDFPAQTRAIKAQEYKELYIAVEAHGGLYEWDLSEGNYPIIAVNVDNIAPEPMDLDIYKVLIKNDILKIHGKDKVYGNDISFKPKDVFTGHLSFIIDYIPATDNVDDVTCRNDINSQEYTMKGVQV